MKLQNRNHQRIHPSKCQNCLWRSGSVCLFQTCIKDKSVDLMYIEILQKEQRAKLSADTFDVG
ncbi:hypothetical protein MGA3_11810 [Bacillus methanolicus MGA3]|nr:hypothetical protein MGA3_11810 [Bacillus methanolicus MGA3]